MLRKCQTSSSSSSNDFSCSNQEPYHDQLTHEPNSDRMILKPFSPIFSNLVLSFVLANGQKLLPFFDDIFKLKSTIYKRMENAQANLSTIQNTNVWIGGKLSRNFSCMFTSCDNPFDSYHLEIINAKNELCKESIFFHIFSL